MTNETTASERLIEALYKAGFQRQEDWFVLNQGEEFMEQIHLDTLTTLARAALPAPADQVLVPRRLLRVMREVLEEEGWTWEDLLAAAEAITEAEHAELQAAPADQPPSQEAREYPPLPEADAWPLGPAVPFFGPEKMRSYVDADRKARQEAALAGELQALVNHVSYWRRAGLDDAPLLRAESALSDYRAAIAKGERHD